MNSSGIKRGLASTAVAALAVAGLPFLASSASAAPAASLLFSGPTRNGGDLGGMQVLSVTDMPDDDGVAGAPFDTGRLKIIGSDLTTPATDVAGDPAIENAVFQGNPATGTGAVVAFVSAATPTDGDTVKYALWVDLDDDGVVDGGEPRVQVSTVLTGAPATLEIAPASQTVTSNAFSGDYNGTVKDAAGRVTQLTTGETATIDAPGTTTIRTLNQPADPSNPVYTDQGTGQYVASFAELPAGTFAFQAADSGSAVTRDIPVTVTGAPAKNVQLVINKTATGLTEADIDVVTGADNWNGFGGGTFGAPKSIRVDQNAIKVDISDANDATNPKLNAGASALVTFTGANGVTFGGKASKTELVTLDSTASGSVTVNVDPGTVNENGTVTITSDAFGGPIVLNYDRGGLAATGATDSPGYVTKIGSPTTVVVTVKDAFGAPVTSGAQVSLTRSGRTANAGTTSRVTVNASGQATFTLPDAGTTAGTENIAVNLFDDQFDGTATAGTGGTISYTADGLGAAVTLTNTAPGAITPLYDAVAAAGAAADTAEFTIGGGTDTVAMTVTVDNGAKILATGETTLSQGADSETVVLTAGADTFRVVGTKAGTVNVTVSGGGRTATQTLTVTPAAGTSNARNVAIEAPENAKAGEVAVFTATVTDAFGNPIAGVLGGGAAGDRLNFQVSGPANLQSNDAVTDANGKLKINVILTDNANSSVSVTATGTGAQFGSKANEINGVGGATGLTASVASATGTVADVVNIAALQEAVDEAQEKVDDRQDALDLAQGNLSVAKAEKSVAQAEVKAAKKDLKQAKKKKKGVAAAKKALRVAKGELKVATAKVNSAKAAVATAKERLADAQEELAEAQAALDEAQS